MPLPKPFKPPPLLAMKKVHNHLKFQILWGVMAIITFLLGYRGELAAETFQGDAGYEYLEGSNNYDYDTSSNYYSRFTTRKAHFLLYSPGLELDAQYGFSDSVSQVGDTESTRMNDVFSSGKALIRLFWGLHLAGFGFESEHIYKWRISTSKDYLLQDQFNVYGSGLGIGDEVWQLTLYPENIMNWKYQLGYNFGSVLSEKIRLTTTKVELTKGFGIEDPGGFLDFRLNAVGNSKVQDQRTASYTSSGGVLQIGFRTKSDNLFQVKTELDTAHLKVIAEASSEELQQKRNRQMSEVSIQMDFKRGFTIFLKREIEQALVELVHADYGNTRRTRTEKLRFGFGVDENIVELNYAKTHRSIYQVTGTALTDVANMDRNDDQLGVTINYDFAF